MVQTLPYIPSFIEQLTPHLNQLANTAGQAVGTNARGKADAAILSQIREGKISAAEMPEAWARLSEGARNKHQPFLESQLRKQEASHKQDIKNQESSYNEQLKRDTEKLDRKRVSDSVISVADEMEGLLDYTGSTHIPWSKSFNATEWGLNRGGLQKREEFDVLAAQAANFFRDLDTKGQLPQGLYEQVIKPRLPSSKLSERQNKGRIDGLRSLARKYGGEIPNTASSDRIKKPEKGTKISEEMAQKILDQSGGDPVKAAETARGLGYEF